MVNLGASRKVYIVGAGSSIFQSLGFESDYTAVSGRMIDLAEMPKFEENSVVIIFSDPPTKMETEALMISIIDRLPSSGNAHVIYISSIAVLFKGSRLDFGRLNYAEKKAVAEDILTSGFAAVTILRLGIVSEVGSWKSTFQHPNRLLVARGTRYMASTSISDIRAALAAIMQSPGRDFRNLWTNRSIDEFVANVSAPLGFRSLYKSRAGHILLKIAKRIFCRFGISVVSPDDILAFDDTFFDNAL